MDHAGIFNVKTMLTLCSGYKMNSELIGTFDKYE
jgi:hypothetical protein